MTVANITQVSWFSVLSFKRRQTYTFYFSLFPHCLLYFNGRSKGIGSLWRSEIPQIRKEAFDRMLLRSTKKLEDRVKNWLKEGREQIHSRKKFDRNPTARTRKSQRKDD